MGRGELDGSARLTANRAATITLRRGSRRGLGVLICLALVAGCGNEPESTAPPPVPAASLPGVYAGDFPCDGCPGIPTRLWIRADGRFFFEQRYPGEAGIDGTIVHALGRWTRGDDTRLVHLDGSGPRRTFARRDRDTLVMQTPSNLEHRLTRDRDAPSFAGTVRMTGAVHAGADAVEFTECLTGYTLPLSRAGDYARFRHQYRSVASQRGPAHAELEGRFSFAADGAPSAITIERFITIRPGDGCSR